MRRRTKDLFDDINKIEVIESKDYGWVWEYAKFRFINSNTGVKVVEEKAKSLLNLIFAVAAGYWALFIYLGGRSNKLNGARWYLVVGVLLVLTSAICALVAIWPRDFRLPFRENVAIRFVNRDKSEKGNKAMGRFALGLMTRTDDNERIMNGKSRWTIAGLVLLLGSAVLFSVGFWFLWTDQHSSSRCSRPESRTLSFQAEIQLSLFLCPSLDPLQSSESGPLYDMF
jgi:hypothetical protein